MVFCDLCQWAPTPDGFDISTITRSQDTFSEDIDALREAAGFDRPVVAGHHGAIALEYARHCPHRVRGVAVIAAVPPAGSGVGVESAEDFFRRDAGVDRLAAHERNRKTRRVPASTETTQDIVDRFVCDAAMGWYEPILDCPPLREGVEVNVPVMNHVFKPAVLGGYQVEEAINVPVFLALGRYDYTTPFYLWDEPKTHNSNLRYRLYERSGHNPPYEEPAEFRRRPHRVGQHPAKVGRVGIGSAPIPNAAAVRSSGEPRNAVSAQT